MWISLFRRDGYLLLRLVLILCQPGPAQAGKQKIVGYYWGKGRPDYELSQVPVQELTHLIYSRAMPYAEGDCVFARPDVDVAEGIDAQG